MGPKLELEFGPKLGTKLGLRFGIEFGPKLGQKLGPKLGIRFGLKLGLRLGLSRGSKIMKNHDLEDLAGKAETKRGCVQPKEIRTESGEQAINKIIIGSKPALKELERYINEKNLDAYVYYTVEACARMLKSGKATIRNWIKGRSNRAKHIELPTVCLSPVWIAFNDLVGYLEVRAKNEASYTVNDLHFLKDINEYLSRPDVILRLKIQEKDE